MYADGSALVDTVFSTTNPLVKINLLKTDAEMSKHIELMNRIIGLFGVIRTPTVNELKIKFPIYEDQALDFMAIVLHIHKKLDKAI